MYRVRLTRRSSGHRVATSISPTKHLDICKRTLLPKPLSDYFPVHMCSCPLCIETAMPMFVLRWLRLSFKRTRAALNRFVLL